MAAVYTVWLVAFFGCVLDDRDTPGNVAVLVGARLGAVVALVQLIERVARSRCIGLGAIVNVPV